MPALYQTMLPIASNRYNNRYDSSYSVSLTETYAQHVGFSTNSALQ